MAKIHVYLNDQLHKQLRELDSVADPVNMSALVRRAVAGEIQRRRAGAGGAQVPAAQV